MNGSRKVRDPEIALLRCGAHKQIAAKCANYLGFMNFASATATAMTVPPARHACDVNLPACIPYTDYMADMAVGQVLSKLSQTGILMGGPASQEGGGGAGVWPVHTLKVRFFPRE
ncbi:MAG TPA: hypothetical protein VHY57_09560 [Rhizomicrobium sp.]|nr:hypothetical protein [Rhizomicrobium sp.]